MVFLARCSFRSDAVSTNYLPRELTATRWLIIILAAINIPLQLFTAYQKSKEKRLANFASLFCKGGDFWWNKEKLYTVIMF